MIIDSHEHLMYPTSKQLEMMDIAGVEKAVLFSTTPHPERAGTLAELEREMSVLNAVLSGSLTPEERRIKIAHTTEEMCAVIRGHRDRFYGFGMVPLGLSFAECCEWIERYIVANGLRGLGEFSPASGQVRQMEVIFKASSAFKHLPLWIHTFSPITKTDILELTALCEKYPQVKVIFGHMGGTNWIDAIHAAKNQLNIYLDLSAVFTTLAPFYALKELPERTLYSSDAPYGSPLLNRSMVEQISPNSRVVQQVLGENLLTLLSD